MTPFLVRYLNHFISCHLKALKSINYGNRYHWRVMKNLLIRWLGNHIWVHEFLPWLIYFFVFWFCTFSYELTLIVHIHMQCPQDNGVVVIPSQVTCVWRQHCLCIIGHINTYTLHKVSQIQSKCRNALSLRGVGVQWGAYKWVQPW